MHEFKSWASYLDFERATVSHARYIHSPEVEEFLHAILITGKRRVEIVPPGTVFWRAQLGHGWRPRDRGDKLLGDVPAPHSPERMKPLSGRSPEGRTNSKGIPCLYLATERDTALAEVRPWMGASISVGHFKTLRELHIVNCTTKFRGAQFEGVKKPESEDLDEVVWSHIDGAFAKPVTPSDDDADYVPTQIIAELFKANGFDGIACRSSLGDGRNVVLFDLDAAGIMKCELFELSGLQFKFEETATPYFISKHGQKKEFEDGETQSPG